MELLTDPAVWASFATLVVLEIVLGVDNVIFISIVSNRLPEAQRGKARRIGLIGALVLRILLLASIAWIVSLSQPFVEIGGFGLSWRDVILIAGGLFLIYKAATEIHAEVEGEEHHEAAGAVRAGMASVIGQIMLLDLVFSIDSVITAVGVADHLEVMVAAVVIAVAVMMVAAGPIAAFVARHPSTKMLALAFLVMIGMALVADGLHYHIERGFIYAAMVFGGFVEVLNLLRGRGVKRLRGI
ncbi:TerC family protein [Acuticoccus sp. I52.16.1]|uniref:TerC family protein n=1 Tax=Acuticoccus sp. I52.16.1 TaxID=2928472 RepID=UPI001FD37C78|nr:TerC family protein [Acuticoccus sp. I52.16.1]UOM33974.1 TerC family protein [Acuticoccus sp. I52.16.1]